MARLLISFTFNNAFVTSPLNWLPDTVPELTRLNPGLIVVNPAILVCGVNTASLLMIAMTVSAIRNLFTICEPAPVSNIVSTIGPDVPLVDVYVGPMVIQADPLHTLSCRLVVSHHKSPITGLLGAVELAAELEIGYL